VLLDQEAPQMAAALACSVARKVLCYNAECQAGRQAHLLLGRLAILFGGLTRSSGALPRGIRQLPGLCARVSSSALGWAQRGGAGRRVAGG
jgi:hypothetical protein